MTYLEPLDNGLALRLAQAVCGDDHLKCSWPGCGCKSTKQKINAVALVVATEIDRIRNGVADAHLIAAAPGLLVAIRGILDENDGRGSSLNQTLIDNARAAIAKAEGK